MHDIADTTDPTCQGGADERGGVTVTEGDVPCASGHDESMM
jgi:hypothetical protein